VRAVFSKKIIKRVYTLFFGFYGLFINNQLYFGSLSWYNALKYLYFIQRDKQHEKYKKILDLLINICIEFDYSYGV